MDFIYLLMNCAVTAFIIVAIASAFWFFILVLLTDSSDRHSRLYVITYMIGAITIILFGIKLLVGVLK